MGESAEEIAAIGGEANGLGSSKANHIVVGAEKNRRGAKGSVGEAESAGKEGGVASG
jgi:hypothetical protein